MGIKDLGAILNKANAISTKPLAEYRGKRIAIDMSSWYHIYSYGQMLIEVKRINLARGEKIDPYIIQTRMLQRLVKFIITMLNYRITPIFVFDGPPPIEKQGLIEERQAQSKERKEKVAKLYEDILSDDLGSNVTDKIGELEKLLVASHPNKGGIISRMRELLIALEIPWFNSNTEAERLCAMLCREGIVDAVFVRDNDTIIHGCPLVITKIDEHSDNIPVCCAEYAVLKKYLGFTDEQIIDMGIALGTDYNPRKFKVGPVKILKLLKDHKSIDNIPGDNSCYNHHVVRKLFMPVRSETLYIESSEKVVICKLTDYRMLRESLRSLDCDGYMENIIKTFDGFCIQSQPAPITVAIQYKQISIAIRSEQSSNDIQSEQTQVIIQQEQPSDDSQTEELS